MHDMIEETVRDRAKKFYKKNIKLAKKLENLEGYTYCCPNCNNEKYVLYTKFGGNLKFDKKGRPIQLSNVPATYNFICKCGSRLVLREGTFNYAKIKYGCKADKCPDGRTSMTKNCLKCQFIFEK